LLIARGVKVFSVNCTLGDIGTSDSSQSRSALANLRLAETEKDRAKGRAGRMTRVAR
jgi:LmbE family N-acetylglucosaminyl deacetylase